MTQVVQEILQRIEQLPEAERLLLEQQLAEAKRKRQALDARPQERPHRSQDELLADLRRRSYTPPVGTPESVELLRQDRERRHAHRLAHDAKRDPHQRLRVAQPGNRRRLKVRTEPADDPIIREG